MRKIKKTQLNTLNSDYQAQKTHVSDAYYNVETALADYIMEDVVQGLAPIINTVLQTCKDSIVGYDPKVHSMFKADKVDWQTIRDVFYEIDSDTYEEIYSPLRNIILEAVLRNVPDDSSVDVK